MAVEEAGVLVLELLLTRVVVVVGTVVVVGIGVVLN